ncbi:response regulator transcription factor [Clostridium septicum]|uniref:Stage 0 sporulation protein A homolog n=2 Tax=Clostridium septicum TaxID=1504 RepID=A0A9N7JK75_CLOSE|nr:response regulator transcription factor [Clostridium septicum]AYE34108.1 DNA-binding response regulator [Clostridium septicum]MDU1313096.1 response regulator transcription factor [Clostridium septicum]QAS59475.1 response regulator transcription factor [Clostridium septicum]UEC21268.1 response regulator transcription factor [Clostridium septicum]USS02530.1 response regulator transcription factor [Clostridium septicum]
MAYTILIAEDDPDIVELLRLYLSGEGYNVVSVDNGIDALEITENQKIDLAVIDVMMPGMNGYNVTEEIRKHSNIPIIILSAKNQEYDKILGLNIGADDYMTKPFSPIEIIARINSNLRRFYQLGSNNLDIKKNSKVSLGEICIDIESFKVEKNGHPVNLAPMEFKILVKLMKSPGRVFTKTQIYQSVCGEFFESDDNTMMVHISKLREKLEDDPKNPRYIKTIRGLGYKFENP